MFRDGNMPINQELIPPIIQGFPDVYCVIQQSVSQSTKTANQIQIIRDVSQAWKVMKPKIISFRFRFRENDFMKNVFQANDRFRYVAGKLFWLLQWKLCHLNRYIFISLSRVTFSSALSNSTIKIAVGFILTRASHAMAFSEALTEKQLFSSN